MGFVADGPLGVLVMELLQAGQLSDTAISEDESRRHCLGVVSHVFGVKM